ncbi:MAG: glutathione S-transferase N-terminal domain-containing protein [Sandaracinaceae bacterium]
MTDRTACRDRIAALLRETAEAHHQAFAATDGQDPDWAIWYAEHLGGRIDEVLGVERGRTDLVRFLAQADEEHRARAPEAAWTAFYADLLVEHHLSEPEERLSLYYFPSCPFCRIVLRAIDELGIQARIELRNIWEDDQHRADLVAARGRGTVPVLRCDAGDVTRWMPESRDIARYLRKRFG